VNRVIAAGVLVRVASPDGLGPVLLIRRKEDGLWSVPGGFLNPGERAQACAMREFEEETGVSLQAPPKRLGYSPTERGDLFALYGVTVPKEFNITADRREIIDWDWFEPARAVKLPLYPGLEFFLLD
jgi:8-oxo-dGTP pyrophosphatase MutT (NUDIX family)